MSVLMWAVAITSSSDSCLNYRRTYVVRAIFKMITGEPREGRKS